MEGVPPASRYSYAPSVMRADPALLYPLRFHPLYRERVWGGRRLATVFGRALPPGGPWGESWEVSDVPGLAESDVSRVAYGSLAGTGLDQLVARRGRELLGAVPARDGHFPLLVKILDAAQELSVQVHPDEAYARAHPGARVKTEAWHVLHAEPEALIYHGLRPGVDRAAFENAVAAGRVMECLRAVEARAGQTFFLPAGTVHALGGGVMVAEVQTPSDTTFRLYDWGRVGLDGKPRELHVAEALECIAWSTAPAAASGGAAMVDCPFFRLDRVELAAGGEETREPGAMAVWMVIAGRGELETEDGLMLKLAGGDTLLLPASRAPLATRAHEAMAWLEITVP